MRSRVIVLVLAAACGGNRSTPSSSTPPTPTSSEATAIDAGADEPEPVPGVTEHCGEDISCFESTNQERRPGANLGDQIQANPPAPPPKQ